MTILLVTASFTDSSGNTRQPDCFWLLVLKQIFHFVTFTFDRFISV